MEELIAEMLSYTPRLLDLAVFLLGLAVWPSILLSRKQPVAMLAWLLTVTLIPVVGPVFYLAFGLRPRLPSLPRKKIRADRAIRPYLETRLGPDPDPSPLLAAVPEVARPGLTVAERVGDHPLTAGNRLRLCDGAAQKYDRLIADIQAASHHVHLEYFKLRDDQFGRRIAEVLSEQAAAGVEVRLLLDGVGSIWLSRRYIAQLRAAGVDFRWFHPLNPLRRRWSLNIRNHRKVAVIDGAVGYVGGINLGDEYLGRDPHSGAWHDLSVRLEGPAVQSLQRVFSEDWHFVTGELLDDPAYFPEPTADEDGALVQVVNSMPSDEVVSEMHQIYFACLSAARRRVWIMSPYFLPNETIQTALASLALGGVDVRVLVTDRIREQLVSVASRSFFPPMVDAGVRIYRFRADATLHAKALLVDDQLALVGSANLDQRSFRINYETGALVFDTGFAHALEQAFESKFSLARLLTAEQVHDRPFPQRVVEAVARLAAPLF